MGSMMFGQTAPGIAALGVARGAAIEVFDVLDRVPPIDSSSDEGLKPEKVEGEVVFDSVGFSYVSEDGGGIGGSCRHVEGGVGGGAGVARPVSALEKMLFKGKN